MPVSVAVCETANVVNAALRESLGVNVGGGCVSSTASRASAAAADEAKTGISNGNGNNGSACDDSVDNLQSQIVANAKRVLLAKIEYEEVENYRESVLENLKSKYVIIKPNSNSNANGTSTGGNCIVYGNKNGNSNGGKILGTNGHENNGHGHRLVAMVRQPSAADHNQQNPNELPKPKRVLYPRENILIGWKQSERKWQVGTGLLNVGNTCYLNSTLQALFHIPALANWLMSESAHLENCNIAESGGCCIICAMAKTLLSTQTSSSAMRPFHIYTKLKQICKHMVVGRQEDAHEFLRFLVEAMEKAYLMRYRNYKELDQLVKETTPLNQIFGGYLRSEVRCLACNHVSITFQHFQDLLLDIRKADTLEEAFDGHFSRERLEDMGYKCEGCKKKVSATKQFSLERAPITLCIQLKRFSMMGNKLTKQITFKPRIDLSRYAARSPTAAAQPLSYRLVSLITHLGVSQHCGHYTAIGLTETGSYYNFDDSYVRPIAMQSVCTTNAYIMFYELDVSNAPARSLSQPLAVVSSPKFNGLRLTNGQHSPSSKAAVASATLTSASAPASPTRFIGPQLPPGGLNGYGSMPLTNGHVSSNSQKIGIHFKNMNSSSSNSNASLVKQTTNGLPQNHQAHQNGLLTGTGKFQESAHAKSPLVGPLHKGEVVAIANGNKSSSSNASHQQQRQNHSNVYLPMSSEEDEDDDVAGKNTNSSRQGQGKVNSPTQLPSMPKLFGSTTPVKPKVPLKSLVPYESASEEEESNVVAAGATAGIIAVNPRKRRSDTNSDSSDTENEDDAMHLTNGNGHCKTNGAQQLNGNRVKTASATSTMLSMSSSSSSSANVNNSKQKTDAIDEIFKSLNNYSYKSKHKSPALMPNPDTDDGDDDNEDEVDCNTTMLSNGWRPQKLTQSQISRTPPSPKTPPSPAVIKTNTGIWQVTRNDEDEDDDDAATNNDDDDDDENVRRLSNKEENKAKNVAVTVKNPKNPFSNRTPSPAVEANVKRQKLLNGSAKTTTQRIGNGYQSEATNNGNAVNELLKQSHRGYGSTVLTWKGQQTEVEKELMAEAREQRQRDHDDDEENDVDRGRQRKVKSVASKSSSVSSSIPGYNPFQEYENQKRWHKSSNGCGSYPRFYQQNFRQNFQQRNKFKFNRFGGPGTNKFQQQRALQRHLANGGGFTRHQHSTSSQQQQQQQQQS